MFLYFLDWCTEWLSMAKVRFRKETEQIKHLKKNMLFQFSFHKLFNDADSSLERKKAWTFVYVELDVFFPQRTDAFFEFESSLRRFKQK